MGVAILVHSRSHQASECGWYFIVYCMDCSLGLTLAIAFHKLTNATARWFHSRQIASKDFTEEHPWWEALVEIGNYGDAAAPNIRKWGIQVFFWVACVICARCIVGVVVVTCAPFFMSVTAALDAYFKGRPELYLYTVMVCIPLVVNVGQAWVQDQVLKWKHKRQTSKRGGDDEDDGQPYYHHMDSDDGHGKVLEGGSSIGISITHQGGGAQRLKLSTLDRLVPTVIHSNLGAGHGGLAGKES